MQEERIGTKPQKQKIGVSWRNCNAEKSQLLSLLWLLLLWRSWENSKLCRKRREGVGENWWYLHERPTKLVLLLVVVGVAFVSLLHISVLPLL